MESIAANRPSVNGLIPADPLGLWLGALAASPEVEADPTADTTYYATGWAGPAGAPCVLDWGYRLEPMVSDLLRTFPDLYESGDICVWQQQAGRGPQLVACVRPGPDGDPAVTWL